MKHDLRIVYLLVGLFFLAQVVGLLVVNEYIDHQSTAVTGNVTFVTLPYDIERPEVEESSSFWYLLSAILVGTLLVLLLVKLNKVFIWKAWLFLSVWLVLTVSLAAFLPQNMALVAAILFAGWKIGRPNIIVHNLTEVFIYGGLAAIFVPIMNVFSAFMMLLFISLYDMYAVWKSKHMVKMAKFQAKSKVFAGLFVPYHRHAKRGIAKKSSNAILGGGDIGFTLIFAGVVMKGLMLANPVALGFLKALIIPVAVSGALLLLFLYGKKDRFYPAMPFLSAGAIVGYLIVLAVA